MEVADVELHSLENTWERNGIVINCYSQHRTSSRGIGIKLISVCKFRTPYIYLIGCLKLCMVWM